MPAYMIREGDDGPVKIGTAFNVEKRLESLQCGNSRRLKVIRLIEGPADAERLLHWFYREHRIRFEWFNFCPSMLTVDAASIVIPPTLPKEKRGALPDGQETFVGTAHLGFLKDLAATYPKQRVLAHTLGVSQAALSNWLRRGVPWPLRNTVATVAASRGVAVPDGFLGAP